MFSRFQGPWLSLCLACGKAILYHKWEQTIHRFVAAHLLFDFWTYTAPPPQLGRSCHLHGGRPQSHSHTTSMLCTEGAGGKNSRSMVISLQSAPHTTRLYCCTDLSSNHTTFTSHMQQRQNKLPSLCLACGKAILYHKWEQPIHRFAAHLLFDFWTYTAPPPQLGTAGGHNHTATPPPKPKQCDCAQPRTPNSKTPARSHTWAPTFQGLKSSSTDRLLSDIEHLPNCCRAQPAAGNAKSPKPAAPAVPRFQSPSA